MESTPAKCILGDNSTLVHLVSISDGSVRSMTLTRILPPQLVMKGIALTEARMPGYSKPAISAIVLRKLPSLCKIEDVDDAALGEVEPHNMAF